MEWQLSKGVLEKLSCPNCNSQSIAKILWGYLEVDKELQKAIQEKNVVLGGCYVTDQDPKWECNDCNHRWGHRDEDDKIDSFDYDQGYNLDEVYDQ